MEQNNINNEDVRQRVDVGVGADVDLNNLPPAGGMEEVVPVRDGNGREQEDLNRDENVRNHMAALLEAIQQNRVTLRPVAERRVAQQIAQAAAGEDAAADPVGAGVGAAAAQPQPDDQEMVGPEDEIMGEWLIRPGGVFQQQPPQHLMAQQANQQHAPQQPPLQPLQLQQPQPQPPQLQQPARPPPAQPQHQGQPQGLVVRPGQVRAPAPMIRAPAPAVRAPAPVQPLALDLNQFWAMLPQDMRQQLTNHIMTQQQVQPQNIQPPLAPQQNAQHPYAPLQNAQPHHAQLPRQPAQQNGQLPANWIPAQQPLASPFSTGGTSCGAGGPVYIRDSTPTVRYKGNPGESWECFLEKWEKGMAKMQLSDGQLASHLPDCLEGGAYQVYRAVVSKDPALGSSYTKLKAALGEEFLDSGTLVWDIRQEGKTTVLEYYGNFMEIANSLWPDLSASHKDSILVQAFVNGLKPDLKRAMLKKKPRSLEQARKEAAKLEDVDHRMAADKRTGSKLVASINHPDPMASLKKEVAAIKSLMESQAREQARANSQPQQNGGYSGNSRGRGRGRGRGGYRNNRGGYQGKGQSPQQTQPPPPYQQKTGQPQSRQGIQCFKCHQFGHIKNECPMNKAINMVDLEGDEFADFVLSQPPAEEPKEVNSIQVDRPKKKNSGKKLTYTQMMMLGLLTFCCLMGPAAAAPVQAVQVSASMSFVLPLVFMLVMVGSVRGISNRTAQPVYAEKPMICSSSAVAKPSIHPINHQYKCQSAPSLEGKYLPTPVKTTVYRENFIEWKSKAYQCMKTKVVVSTQVSFFSDIKNKRVSKSVEPVSHGECVDMVRSKSCVHGTLSGSDGAYTTSNTADISYVYCCEWNDFPVSQCSYIETSVYKKHGEEGFFSSAGDVSHCGSYDTGHCKLKDGSLLLWDVEKETMCQYQEWYNVEGLFLDGHFVSTNEDLALTFGENGLNGVGSTCGTGALSQSDQGLVVKFNTSQLRTNLTETSVNRSITAQVGVGSRYQALLAQLSGMIQPLALDIAEVQTKLYWSSYRYTCHNMVQVLKTVSILAEQHPTSTARFLMGTSEVRADAGPGFLQVYPCTPATNYSLLPMAKDNCTALIPVNITVSNVTHIGFLDPTDNVVHRQSMFVPCEDKPQIALRLEGQLYWYMQNGTTESISSSEDLDIPGVSLGAHPLHIHKTVYDVAYHLNWQSFSTHSDLNDVLATLSRQKQVLEAMGIQSGLHETLEKNVIESKENLIGGAWMAFLTGGHVSSAFELWNLACNCLTSLIVIVLVGACVHRRCCSQTLERPVNIVAAIDLESQCGDSESFHSGQSTDEVAEICDGSVCGEEETRLVDQAEQTSFTDFPDMVSYDRENGPTPTAPPAYTPIYPPLQ